MLAAPARRSQIAAGAIALALLPAAVALPASLAAQTATPAATHVYRVDGSLADERGGPSLVGQGGTVGPSSYTFGPGQGLTLANALNPSVYSLELSFTFGTVSGYRKVVDFNARLSDVGLYVNNGLVYLNGSDVGATPVFQANTPAHLVLTRDAGNVFTAYVNGVAARTFLDNAGAAVFRAPGQIAWLFVDDRSANENSAGALHWARVYDVALTGEQARARFAAGDDALPGAPTPPTNVVPEPSTWALLGTGLLLVAGTARRRRVAA